MAYNYEYPYVDPGMYNDDWLLNKMKQLSAEWEAMQVKFMTLEEYVKNYFANLDVQDEINNKIDAMLADGSFSDQVMAHFPAGQFGPSIYVGDMMLGSMVRNINNVIYSGPVTNICESGVSLMGPSKTIYSLLSSRDLSAFRNVFIMLSDSDYEFSIASVNSAVGSLQNLLSAQNGRGRLIILPRPVSSVSPSRSDVENYYKYYAAFQVIATYVPIPLVINIDTADWLSGTQLTPTGQNIYANLVGQYFNGVYNASPTRDYIFDGSLYHLSIQLENIGKHIMMNFDILYKQDVSSKIVINFPVTLTSRAVLAACMENSNYITIQLSNTISLLPGAAGHYTASIMIGLAS